MSTQLKYLKKGSDAKFKDLINQIKNTRPTYEDRKKILEIFKKREIPQKPKSKKIAKPEPGKGV
jgi:hypothetical protein